MEDNTQVAETVPVKTEYDIKAEELSAQLKVTVFPIVFPTEDDNVKVVGYFKEAGRLASIDAADLAYAGKYIKAGHTLFASTFLKEASDAAVEKNDAYYRTACLMLGQRIEMAIPDIKKN